jgi:hypothetical protein
MVVNVKYPSKITRLASLNHATSLHYNATSGGQEVTVELAKEVDRLRVPHKDFVLYIRDELAELMKPSGVYYALPDGGKAILL